MNAFLLHQYNENCNLQQGNMFLTWQNPETPEIDSKLNALARKASKAFPSLRSTGGPGAVGIARRPRSCPSQRLHILKENSLFVNTFRLIIHSTVRLCWNGRLLPATN